MRVGARETIAKGKKKKNWFPIYHFNYFLAMVEIMWLF